jgi:hypothetical protein
MTMAPARRRDGGARAGAERRKRPQADSRGNFRTVAGGIAAKMEPHARRDRQDSALRQTRPLLLMYELAAVSQVTAC